MTTLPISLIDDNMPFPAMASPGACAFDLYTREDILLSAVVPYCLAPTNIRVKVPEGHALFIQPRSSSFHKGFTVILGLIDRDYCGPEDEVMVQLHLVRQEPLMLKAGERIAQATLLAAPMVQLKRSAFGGKNRGGFGSTDK